MWLWVTVLKESHLSKNNFFLPPLYFSPKKIKEENHPLHSTSYFTLSYSKIFFFFFPRPQQSECGFGCILLLSASNFLSPRQLRVRNGTLGSSQFYQPWFLWSSATSPNLSRRSEWAEWSRRGGHDTTSQEFWKALRTYPLPIGGWGRGWATATWHYANATLRVARFETYQEAEELFFLNFFTWLYFRADLLFEQPFDQNAWWTCRPLSRVDREAV